MIDLGLKALSTLGYRFEYDYADRLHCFVTSNLLIALSMLVSYKQFGGRPIECMLPKVFPRSWEEYAENYCWAQDTYFLSFDVDVTRQTSRNFKISYYQWVPFFLLIEAACFRLPSLVWQYLAAHSGIRIHDIVALAVDERNIQIDVKQNNIRSLTVHLQNALRFHRRLIRKRIRPHKVLRFLNLPYSAMYVTFTYMLTKLLYLFNVWAQLLLLNRFLHTDKYSWYGWGVLSDLLNGTTWKTSGVFPRVTLCDFEVRGMGNLQQHTVQCVLVINIFNEKIFIFLWFWFMTLMLLTTASFLYWLIVMVLPWTSRWFISRHLELSEMPFDPKGSAKDVERFVSGYLKTDGIFVLRMITMHSGIIFGTELVLSLWRSFYGIEEKVRRGDSDPAYLTPTPTSPPTGDDILNTLRQRSSKADKLRAQKKSKLLEDDDDEIVLSNVKPKQTEENSDEGEENAGLTDILLKGPGRGGGRRKLKLRPTAPLDMPDSKLSKARTARSAPSRVEEVKIDLGEEVEDNEDEEESEESDRTITSPNRPRQRHQENVEIESGPSSTANVRNTARELDKYFSSRIP